MKTKIALTALNLAFVVAICSTLAGTSVSGRQLVGFASSYDLQGGAFSEGGETILGVDQAA